MTMLWIGVGTAVVGAGASIYGANKQAKASQKAGDLNLGMFNTLNAQQQPYIQSGYGALSRLNTLLGLSPRPQSGPVMSTPMTASSGNYGPIEQFVARAMAARQGGAGGNAYMPTAGGGVQPIMTNGPRMYAGGPGGDPYMGGGQLPLARILALRAAHGDTQAGTFLGRMQQ